MSTFSQNPDPTTFDEITATIPRPSAWEIMFDAAEEELRATRPEGFETEEIGRNAWGNLPESERPAALDVLFYTFWAAVQSDADEMARYERERDVRTALRARLDEFELLTRLSSPVSRDLVEDIATLAAQLHAGGLR